MKTKLFFYKLLMELRTQGINPINVENLASTKEVLVDILFSYGYHYYANEINSIKNFSLFILLVFVDFGMGIYDKTTNNILFSDELSMDQLYFENVEIDITKKQISEFATFLALELEKQKQLTLN